MAARKIFLDEVPVGLRVKSRNDFIRGVLLEAKSRLTGPQLAIDLQVAGIDEFVDDMLAFGREYYPEDYPGGNSGGNVQHLSQREEHAS